MEITAQNFVVFCDERDSALAKQLLQTLGAGIERVLVFFRLNCIEEKVNIIIYSDADDYKNHVERVGQQYFDWMIADTFDGKINILSIDLCRMTGQHKNISKEDYSKLIIHEFVHICQQFVNPDCSGCIWFWEALATNLSGQNIESPAEFYTKDELMYHYTELPFAYSVSCALGRYMLENMAEEKIYGYVKEPELLRRDAENIIKSAAVSMGFSV